MEIHKFTEKDHKHWEEFVKNANNGTIFHTLKFLSYHPPERFKNSHLIIKKKNNIISLFPANEEKSSIISHKGASYGGFVLKDGIGIHKTYLIVEHLIAYLKAHKYKKIVLTQPPLIYYKEANQCLNRAIYILDGCKDDDMSEL